MALTTDRQSRRLLRRELHRSRSIPAAAVLVVVVLVAAWAAVECALVLLGREPLLARPGAVVDAAVSMTRTPSTLVAVTGGALVLLGIVLVGLALAPGRRSRHVVPDERLLVVVDDAVIASSLARTARTAASLGPDRTQAWVSRRRAQVRIEPTTGVALDIPAIRDAVADQVRTIGLDPTLAVRVSTSERERVA